MVRFCRLLFIALALINAKASAQLPEITVGFYDFAPLIYLNERKQPAGTLYRFTEETLKHAGIKARYREMPTARLYQELRQGHVHLWLGASGKPELEGYTLEGNRLLGTLSLHLHYPKGQPIPQLPRDLAGKNLITLSGYSYWPYTQRHVLAPELGAIQLRTSTHQAALELLAKGRGDYLLNYQVPTQHHAKQQGLELESVLIEEIPARFIISAKYAHARALREALDNTYDQMLYSGKRMSLEYY